MTLNNNQSIIKNTNTLYAYYVGTSVYTVHHIESVV